MTNGNPYEASGRTLKLLRKDLDKKFAEYEAKIDKKISDSVETNNKLLAIINTELKNIKTEIEQIKKGEFVAILDDIKTLKTH